MVATFKETRYKNQEMFFRHNGFGLFIREEFQNNLMGALPCDLIYWYDGIVGSIMQLDIEESTAVIVERWWEWPIPDRPHTFFRMRVA
jgi:hypothetical protein